MNTRLKNKVFGSLVGFAIGDAMGATTEFMTREQIKQEYDYVDDILGGGWLNLPRGQVTDDTQMMLCVARGIMSSSIYESPMPYIAAEFIKWLDSNPPDVGNCCRRAITQNRNYSATFWHTANEFYQESCGKQDLGNGGLMRCLVPCLMEDPVTALRQSQLTHSNGICDTAIMTYYCVIKSAVHTNRIDPRPHLMSPTGHVENTLNNAVYWGGKSFKEGILGAVNDGGDADTIAALTGGILGARFGYNRIKATAGKWIKHLDYKVLQELEVIADYIAEERG